MGFLKLLFITLLVGSVFFVSAQDEVELSKRSELKINGLYLLLGGLELDYEYILNEESSLGVSATYFFDDDVEFNWGITPHYRLFFGNQPALGFFVEGQVSVFGRESYDYTSSVFRTENVTSIGGGIAVGGKFKSKRDVVVEVYAGLGRVIGNDVFDIEAYPRLGINIGKRF